MNIINDIFSRLKSDCLSSFGCLYYQTHLVNGRYYYLDNGKAQQAGFLTNNDNDVLVWTELVGDDEMKDMGNCSRVHYEVATKVNLYIKFPKTKCKITDIEAVSNCLLSCIAKTCNVSVTSRNYNALSIISDYRYLEKDTKENLIAAYASNFELIKFSLTISQTVTSSNCDIKNCLICL